MQLTHLSFEECSSASLSIDCLLGQILSQLFAEA